jgi:putative queuosine salvage protein
MPGVIPDEQLAREQLRFLEIVPEGIARMESVLAGEPLSLPRWDDAPILPGVTPEVAEYMLLINSCNFSYWPDPGQPEWGVELKGRWWPDALGLFGCFARALERDPRWLDGGFLAGLSRASFDEAFAGTGPLPMADARYRIVREVGEALSARWQGRFWNLIEEASGDAVRLAELLIATVPPFNDVRELGGQIYAFHKRPQLAVAMICGRFERRGLGDLRRFEELTVFADYMLPRALRGAGILRYGEELARIVDAGQEIPEGHPMEVELRQATLVSTQRIVTDLVHGSEARAPRPEITASHLDQYLWRAGFAQPGLRPFHRTRTTSY